MRENLYKITTVQDIAWSVRLCLLVYNNNTHKNTQHVIIYYYLGTNLEILL